MFNKKDIKTHEDVLDPFFKRFKEVYQEIETESLEEGYISSMVTSFHSPTPDDIRTIKQRSRKMKRLLISKIAAATMAVTLIGGTGAAYAGVLPDPVQEVAYQTASKAGVEIPRGWRHRDGVDGDTTNNGQNQPEDAGKQYKNGQEDSVETQGQGTIEQKKLQEQEKLQEQNILQNKGTDTQIREEAQNMNNSDQGMGDMDRVQDREQLRTEDPEKIEDPIQEQKQIKLGQQ